LIRANVNTEDQRSVRLLPADIAFRECPDLGDEPGQRLFAKPQLLPTRATGW
jgi:hypothetical protein